MTESNNNPGSVEGIVSGLSSGRGMRHGGNPANRGNNNRFGRSSRPKAVSVVGQSAPVAPARRPAPHGTPHAVAKKPMLQGDLRKQAPHKAMGAEQRIASDNRGEKKSAAPRGRNRNTLIRRVIGTETSNLTALGNMSRHPAGVVVGPKLVRDRLRIIPLGGQEEVGRNMTIFEYNDDIVIIDMGLQWPEADMPGIDYIVPNVNYLKGKEKNIRGVIFTHGHLDHIGAAPILLRQLGYPTVISRDLTLALIKDKVEDQEKGAVNRLKTIRVKTLDDKIKLGVFEAGFFEVEHSIMDAMGIVLKTPAGTVIHMGDWTIANEPIDPHQIDYKHLSKLPRPTILMLESLGALKKGLPPSEQEVHRNLQDLLAAAPGRIVIGTFASQIRRIAYILEYCERIGKVVALDGYSMKKNIEIAKQLGYVKMKPETLITVNDIHKYPENKIVVICTGAQGELNAALAKIVTDNHRFIKLQKNDTIVFSSSVIPGNERAIQRLKDNLYRKCNNVIHSDIMDIHIGGHSTASGIEEVLRQVEPTYFLPVYANHYFLKEAGKIAYRLGYPDKNVSVLDNGHVFELDLEGVGKILPEKVDSSYVFIDGLGVGDIGHVVLRDRQMLAEDGMIMITVIIDGKTKKIVGNIQITSRGFIHVKENFDLVNETKRKVQKAVQDYTSKGTSMDWDAVRNEIRESVGQFLFTKTERRPMVLPVVIEV